MVRSMVRGALPTVVLPLLVWSVVAVQSLGYGFVWDDIPMIDGPVIHDLSKLPDVFAHRTMYASVNDGVVSHGGLQTYRPMTIATFMVDAALYGRSPWGYHLTSVLLHLLTAWVVLLLTQALAPNAPRWGPVVAATWFLVGPFQVEAYVWINGRSDVLSTLFGAGLVLAYVRAHSSDHQGIRWRWELACVLLALLCLLSKETGVAWLAALSVVPTRSVTSLRARVVSLVAPAVGALVYGLMRVSALDGVHAANDSQIGRVLLIAPYVVLDALSQIVAPRYTTVRGLEFEMRDVGLATAMIAWIVLAGIGLGAWMLRRRMPSVLFGLATAVGSLAPVAFIATMRWPGFGRYAYAASASLAPALMVVAIALFAWLRPRVSDGLYGIVRASVGAYLVLLATMSVLAGQPYASEHELYQSWIAGTPGHPHGYRWLGLTYMEDGRYADAFGMLNQSRKLDLLDDTLPMFQIQCLQALGQTQAAVAFADTVAWDYRDPHMHRLALVSLATTDPKRALAHVERCLELDPRSDPCRFWRQRLTEAPPH